MVLRDRALALFLFYSMSDVTSTSKRRRGRPAGPVAMMTIAEVASMTRFAVPTVYGWTRQLCVDGRTVLPVVKFGNLVRVKVSDVEQVPARQLLRCRRSVSFFAGEVSGS